MAHTATYLIMLSKIIEMGEYAGLSIKRNFDLSAKLFYNGICVDASQGIYLVNESGYSGLPNPNHVQKRVVGQQALNTRQRDVLKVSSCLKMH